MLAKKFGKEIEESFRLDTLSSECFEKVIQILNKGYSEELTAYKKETEKDFN